MASFGTFLVWNLLLTLLTLRVMDLQLCHNLNWSFPFTQMAGI